jgi:hypothetical protein
MMVRALGRMHGTAKICAILELKAPDWECRMRLMRSMQAGKCFLVACTVLILGSMENPCAAQSRPKDKSLEEIKKATSAKLEELLRIVEDREAEWKITTQRRRELGETVETGETPVETAGRLLREAEEISTPKKVAPLTPLPPEVEAPAVVEQEEGLERLRRNQRALTDQRIGDVIILRANP